MSKATTPQPPPEQTTISSQSAALEILLGIDSADQCSRFRSADPTPLLLQQTLTHTNPRSAVSVSGSPLRPIAPKNGSHRIVPDERQQSTTTQNTSVQRRSEKGTYYRIPEPCAQRPIIAL